MKIYQTEGIILHALNFRDYDQILTVFTLDEGVAKFIVKRSLTKKGSLNSLLTRVELIYTKGKSDLFLCREISLLKMHLELRKKIEWLQTAFHFISIIQRLRLEQNPSPILYETFIRYLEQIPFIDFRVLKSSFHLKILKHEGFFPFHHSCCECGTSLQRFWILQGECYCTEDRPTNALYLQKEEMTLIEHLANVRSFSQLGTFSLPADLEQKIYILFLSALGF